MDSNTKISPAEQLAVLMRFSNARQRLIEELSRYGGLAKSPEAVVDDYISGVVEPEERLSGLVKELRDSWIELKNNGVDLEKKADELSEEINENINRLTTEGIATDSKAPESSPDQTTLSREARLADQLKLKNQLDALQRMMLLELAEARGEDINSDEVKGRIKQAVDNPDRIETEVAERNSYLYDDPRQAFKATIIESSLRKTSSSKTVEEIAQAKYSKEYNTDPVATKAKVSQELANKTYQSQVLDSATRQAFATTPDTTSSRPPTQPSSQIAKVDVATLKESKPKPEEIEQITETATQVLETKQPAEKKQQEIQKVLEAQGYEPAKATDVAKIIIEETAQTPTTLTPVTESKETIVYSDTKTPKTPKQKTITERVKRVVGQSTKVVAAPLGVVESGSPPESNTEPVTDPKVVESVVEEVSKLDPADSGFQKKVEEVAERNNLPDPKGFSENVATSYKEETTNPEINKVAEQVDQALAAGQDNQTKAENVTNVLVDNGVDPEQAKEVAEQLVSDKGSTSDSATEVGRIEEIANKLTQTVAIPLAVIPSSHTAPREISKQDLVASLAQGIQNAEVTDVDSAAATAATATYLEKISPAQRHELANKVLPEGSSLSSPDPAVKEKLLVSSVQTILKTGTNEDKVESLIKTLDVDSLLAQDLVDNFDQQKNEISESGISSDSAKAIAKMQLGLAGDTGSSSGTVLATDIDTAATILLVNNSFSRTIAGDLVDHHIQVNGLKLSKEARDSMVDTVYGKTIQTAKNIIGETDSDILTFSMIDPKQGLTPEMILAVNQSAREIIDANGGEINSDVVAMMATLGLENAEVDSGQKAPPFAYEKGSITPNKAFSQRLKTFRARLDSRRLSGRPFVNFQERYVLFRERVSSGFLGSKPPIITYISTTLGGFFGSGASSGVSGGPAGSGGGPSGPGISIPGGGVPSGGQGGVGGGSPSEPTIADGFSDATGKLASGAKREGAGGLNKLIKSINALARKALNYIAMIIAKIAVAIIKVFGPMLVFLIAVAVVVAVIMDTFFLPPREFDRGDFDIDKIITTIDDCTDIDLSNIEPNDQGTSLLRIQDNEDFHERFVEGNGCFQYTIKVTRGRDLEDEYNLTINTPFDYFSLHTHDGVDPLTLDADWEGVTEVGQIPGPPTNPSGSAQSLLPNETIYFTYIMKPNVTFLELQDGENRIEDSTIVNEFRLLVNKFTDDDEVSVEIQNTATAQIVVGDGPIVEGIIADGCPAPIWPIEVVGGNQYQIRQGPGGSNTHGPPELNWFDDPNLPIEQRRLLPPYEAVDIYYRPSGNSGPRTYVVATHDGFVSAAGTGATGANFVNITSTCGLDFSSRYAHLETYFVSEGQQVRTGDRIGIMGRTGTNIVHLHYEIRSVSGSFIVRPEVLNRSDVLSLPNNTRYSFFKSAHPGPPYIMEPYFPTTLPYNHMADVDEGPFSTAGEMYVITSGGI